MWSSNAMYRRLYKNAAPNSLRIIQKRFISLDSQSKKCGNGLSYIHFLPKTEKTNYFRDIDIEEIEHDERCEKFVHYMDNYRKKTLELREKIGKIKELCSDDAVTQDNVDYEIIGSYAYYLKTSRFCKDSLALYRTHVEYRNYKRSGNIRFKSRLSEPPNITGINDELVIDFAELKNRPRSSNIKNIRICNYKGGIVGVIHDPLGDDNYVANFFSLSKLKQLSTYLDNISELHFMPQTRKCRNIRIFYTVVNDQKRSFRLYSGLINTVTGVMTNKILLYEESNPINYISLYKSKNGNLLFVGIVSFGKVVSTFCIRSNLRLYNIPIPQSDKIFLENRRNSIYCIHRDNNGQFSYISMKNVNTLKPLRKRISADTVDNFSNTETYWNFVGKIDCCVTDIDMFDKHLVLYSLKSPSTPFLYIITFSTTKNTTREGLLGNTCVIKSLNLPVKVGSITPQCNSNYYADNVKLSFTCPGIQSVHYNINLNDLSAELQPMIRLPIKSLVYYVPSRDGKCRIPITLVMKGDTSDKDSTKIEKFTKKGLKCVVYVYGTYGENLNLENYIEHRPLLDMGYVLCFAHVRGGGELGKNWHDAGSKMMKHNSFYDLVDVIECLIAKNITHRKKLAINVSSASGIIGGNIYNIRPDLCSCIIFKLPFMDPFDCLMSSNQPFVQLEYEEFGNPYNEDMTLNYSVLDYVYSYSPCSNVRHGNGPGIVIYCNSNDIRAPWYHSAKFVTLLNSDRIYIKMSDYGHIGTPCYDYAVNTAAEEIAIMDELLEDSQTRSIIAPNTT
ncbi:peptidase, S9A/B/C family, catalytic domain-containing protein [Theileria equi strain WA]|uniref:Prolyl endopeptidase n=1 Tax=Theileria equi strain WA TaxID=1537102 RepID=L0B109_THEEQ|nr:peptidase, S9A/B/C family, catalytic domain-containing protein [Theileria equi strain WA]AFZ81203.1 peptidase, S9A/B/C family, catalytic domain-containing protein [Theileria equi strain WA]|eukprot:XP_004830869.1 peptidase, S9A/B/C family, catalytic domain-containing protein [Theileria equi strain WA]